MCKAPVPGKVKTRLCPPLSPEAAARVARALLWHMVRRFPEAIFCHDPPDSEEFRREFDGACARMPQGEGDLGDRLVDARRHAWGGRVMFFGIDAPDVPQAAVQTVARSKAPVAIGPSSDGGFWSLAVGEDVDLVALLKGTPWSSGREFDHVVANARRLGLWLEIGPTWHDVDDSGDLKALFARLIASDCADDRQLLGRLKLAVGRREWLAELGVDGQPPAAGDNAGS